MKKIYYLISVMVVTFLLFSTNIYSQNSRFDEECIQIPDGESRNFIIESGRFYRLTIKACWMSAYSRIGSYLIYGLNISDPMTGGEPTVLIIAETPSIDWSFSYSLSGSYDANMTITSNGWGDQGVFAILEDLTTACVVSVNNNKINDLIKIYPNPANVQVHIVSEDLQSVSLRVYNIQGKSIISQKITNDHTTIDVSNFSKGVYLFKIIDEKGNVLKTEKIVKE